MNTDKRAYRQAFRFAFLYLWPSVPSVVKRSPEPETLNLELQTRLSAPISSFTFALSAS